MDLLIQGTLFILAVACVGFEFLYRAVTKRVVQQVNADNNLKLPENGAVGVPTNPQFTSFQYTYFIVYFCFLVADWLNAPYHYKIYSEYHYMRDQIAVIYVAGYVSSIVFAPIAITLPDRFGRKSLCCACGLLYAAGSLMKCFNSYLALLLSRIISSTASSVLFAACESWYVHEHLESYDFPSEWINHTLQQTATWNGWLSFLSGILGFFMVEGLGFHAYTPSVLSAVFLVLGVIIAQLKWRDNRGAGPKIKTKKLMIEGLKQIVKTPNVARLGLIQACVEGVIYVFIFLWTPTLTLLFESTETEYQLPIGQVFATFMAAMMIGSKLSKILTRGYNKTNWEMLLFATVIGSACLYWLGAHTSSASKTTTYFAFIFFELACGAYFPAMNNLRSKIIPQKEAAIISVWVRLPMNAIATAALIYLHTEQDKLVGDATLYKICAVAMTIAVVGLILSNFKEREVDEEAEKHEEENVL